MHFQGEDLHQNCLCCPSEKGSAAALKGKIFSPTDYTSFQKGLDVQGLKQEVTEVITLVQNGGKSTKSVPSP